ncbi:MAG: membrane dipeptidase [Chloroflexi bacterium]|nr:membrane dipeptidase [Chloroflexota bacterium]
MTFIIDSHQDIAYNALTFNRDVRLSAREIRKREKDTQIPVWNGGEALVGWPEYQAGQIAVIFATLFLTPWQYRGGDWETQVYQTSRQAYPLYHKQIDFYHRLTEENPDLFQLIRSRKDLTQILSHYQEMDRQMDRPVGIVLLMEGAEGINTPDDLEEYYDLGLRQVGPVWAGNRFCGGTKEDRPFDKEAMALLDVMASLGMVLDISHMREKAALTALDIYRGPVMASHANVRRLLRDSGGERHFTDQVIRKLFERGGTVGVVPFNKFLSPDWTLTSPRESVTINELVSQIDYYCQMAGNSSHVGLGSDFDGGFGYPQIPLEMDTIADLQKLAPILRQKGYEQVDIDRIFGLNWKKHLETILPE